MFMAGEVNNTMALIANLVPFVILIGIMYFVMIRPQKKKDAEIAKMRSNLAIGDEIITSGGIVGLIVNLKDDTILIETGSERTKIRIKRWAIQSNETARAERATAINEARAVAQEKKAAKQVKGESKDTPESK